MFKISIKKLNLALGVSYLPGVGKPQQNQELNHRSHHQKSQVHRPFFWSSLSPEDLGSSGFEKEDCDTDVLNRFINKYFSFLLILTLNRSRITAWRGKPNLIRNITLYSSIHSPTTSVINSIERRIPIRDFLPRQKNILSMIFCWSPMSLMEPREFLELRLEPRDFLERRLDPLRPPGL